MAGILTKNMCFNEKVVRIRNHSGLLIDYLVPRGMEPYFRESNMRQNPLQDSLFFQSVDQKTMNNTAWVGGKNAFGL